METTKTYKPKVVFDYFMDTLPEDKVKKMQAQNAASVRQRAYEKSQLEELDLNVALFKTRWGMYMNWNLKSVVIYVTPETPIEDYVGYVRYLTTIRDTKVWVVRIQEHFDDVKKCYTKDNIKDLLDELLELEYERVTAEEGSPMEAIVRNDRMAAYILSIIFQVPYTPQYDAKGKLQHVELFLDDPNNMSMALDTINIVGRQYGLDFQIPRTESRLLDPMYNRFESTRHGYAGKQDILIGNDGKYVFYDSTKHNFKTEKEMDLQDYKYKVKFYDNLQKSRYISKAEVMKMYQQIMFYLDNNIENDGNHRTCYCGMPNHLKHTECQYCGADFAETIREDLKHVYQRAVKLVSQYGSDRKQWSKRTQKYFKKLAEMYVQYADQLQQMDTNFHDPISYEFLAYKLDQDAE